VEGALLADGASPHIGEALGPAGSIGPLPVQIRNIPSSSPRCERQTRAVDRPSGTTIAIHYPYETITYRYQPTTNTYARFIDGAVTPQVDAADGRPVAPTNVVIIRMRFGALNDGHPEKKRLDAEDVGSGQAIISTNGRVYEGTWSKAAADAPTLLFGPDGLPITLTAGQTFVQVIALSYAYEVVEGTAPDAGIRER